ncbi:hypothetical protein CIHG_06286 [Coccidioides immitis H538.4]|uniref:Uncharacterized protein n=2 Tax=Coccidioides immitis TaxID=5501 RepID=A0A0J8RVA3_COCIT|nr:hypothetical protein CIRG_09567 [Coccidioides immitis RMSCC 2394]KMU88486.1 hypothetical protein CIHG_06286 [Coccidioides immitis H538.4]
MSLLTRGDVERPQREDGEHGYKGGRIVHTARITLVHQAALLQETKSKRCQARRVGFSCNRCVIFWGLMPDGDQAPVSKFRDQHLRSAIHRSTDSLKGKQPYRKRCKPHGATGFFNRENSTSHLSNNP